MNCGTLKTRYAFLLFILAGIFLFVRPVFSATVSEDLARQVAINFLSHLGAAQTVESIEETQSNGTQVAYLVQLSPKGYILVAGDDIRVPVKAYSLTSSFSDLPEAYTQNLLYELEVLTSNSISTLSAKSDDANASYWEYLSQDTNASYWEYLSQDSKQSYSEYLSQDSKQSSGLITILSYTPDTFLLTTQWSQGSPYNSLNPKIAGEPTLTGCTQTALAQIMRYHSYPSAGSGVFTHEWNNQTLTAVMNRPFNWSIMPDKADGSVPAYQRDEVAALMRDLGILNQADFGLDASAATFIYEAFERAFGYAPISSMDISDSDFFATIKDEIDSLRPLLLSMPGHMTVADGYASDVTGKKIHLNLGWGGSYDEYYYLDQTNIIGPYSFSPNHTIYYNIRPCEGDECDPYAPTGGGQPPVINSSLPDMIIDSQTIIRVDAYDPDCDTVTMSTSSTCDCIQAGFDSNLLTLTPVETGVYCSVSIRAQSHDGTTLKNFKVLSLDDMVYLGSSYDIGGQFADVSEVDEYLAYLAGDTTVSGYRGYSTQAFFIWIKDQDGNTVAGPSDDAVSGTFVPGIYTIAASLTSGYYYSYDDDHSSYMLSVTADDMTYTVSDMAAASGISLSCQLSVNKAGEGSGTISALPQGIDCGVDCDELYDCGTEVTLTASAGDSSVFTGWSGDCTGNGLSASIVVDDKMYCTATFKADSDEDSMPDEWETAYGLDTDIDDADEDKDGDGLINIDEYLKGTNPAMNDTDDDGIPDGWEVQYNLDPFVNNASDDADDDGFTDLQEYQRGTDPVDRDSYPTKPMPWLMLLLDD